MDADMHLCENSSTPYILRPKMPHISFWLYALKCFSEYCSVSSLSATFNRLAGLSLFFFDSPPFSQTKCDITHQ